MFIKNNVEVLLYPWNILFSFSFWRYKMISEFTWPNHDLPSDKEAVKRLLQGCGFDHDVAYGKTKVFIRTPRTIFSLEEQRAEMVKRIVLFLQKVRVQYLRLAMCSLGLLYTCINMYSGYLNKWTSSHVITNIWDQCNLFYKKIILLKLSILLKEVFSSYTF